MTERAVFLCEIEPVVCSRPHIIPEFVEWLKGAAPPPIWLHPIRQPYKYKFAIADGVHRVEASRQADDHGADSRGRS
jgi:hypothetical protein